ncbi:adenylate/guanylate cyclase domain-containing protein [Polycladidibacter hongkongensis]|uniref:adenylate/guanylate cyclase domain-containing protein n=1 Tax=Polycladidibacter hongkongensis TaxID=1647556 RepID=UPI00082F3393|nr:adenylate/guanylate cyclase domain-containing protein [Pseudovibrio hongkongensis]
MALLAGASTYMANSSLAYLFQKVWCRLRFLGKSLYRFKISLSWAVSLAFGGLVAVATGLVLYFSVQASFENTRQLGWENAHFSINAVDTAFRNFFNPVEEAILDAHDYIESEGFYLDDKAEVMATLKGLLLADRHIEMAAMIDQTGKIWGTKRVSGAQQQLFYGDDDAPFPVSKLRFPHGSWPSKTDITAWARLIQTPHANYAVVAARIHGEHSLRGTLIASVSLERLSDFLDQISIGSHRTLFLMGGNGRVIAYSNGALPEVTEKPLLSTIEAYGDPVLAQMRPYLVGEKAFLGEEGRLKMAILQENGKEHLLLLKTLDNAGRGNLMAGIYLPAETAFDEYNRMILSLFAGLAVMFVAIAVAVALARRLAAPLQEVSRRAALVGELKFDEIAPMSNSRIRELDHVAQTINTSIGGLERLACYVPRGLMSKLVAMDYTSAVAPSQQHLTMLFTDIVSFTSLSEELETRDLAKLLNDHFAMIMEAVESEGGTLDKFMGDGVLAFWNAPDAREDHAAAALRAARKIADALQKKNASGTVPPLRLRIGLHTGKVIVGNVGGRTQKNYTVVGDAVNVSNRLQLMGKQLAPEAEVVIVASEATAAQLPCHAGLKSAGVHNIRGRLAPVEIWLEVRPATALTRQEHSRSRRYSKHRVNI